MKRVFSKILAGSLLTNAVVYCFGSCVSAMDQNVDRNSSASLLNFFINESLKNKLLKNESESKSIGNKKREKSASSDVSKKEKNQKFNPKNSDISENFEFEDDFDFNVLFFEEKKYFDETINKQLIKSLFVREDNIYLDRLRSNGKTMNKIEWSSVCGSLSMLRIVKFILMLEYLRGTGELKKCDIVDDFLDVVQEIKKDALKKHNYPGDKQISDESLLYFIDYFLPVINSIHCTNLFVPRTLKEIKRSLRLDFNKSYKVNDNGIVKLNKELYQDKQVFKEVFQMLKTLDYFERIQKESGKLVQPEFLIVDKIIKI